jgi:hypothetical protein
MVNVLFCRPVVRESENALRWMDGDTPIEEAANIAQTRLMPIVQSFFGDDDE